MNVKLLKKVRKRYVIEYITRIDDVNHWMSGMVNNDHPMYHVFDNNNTFRLFAHHTKEAAINQVLRWIKMDYQKTKKKRPIIKKTKVWYNG